MVCLLLFLARFYKSCEAFIHEAATQRVCMYAFKPLQVHRKSESRWPLPTARFALGGDAKQVTAMPAGPGLLLPIQQPPSVSFESVGFFPRTV